MEKFEIRKLETDDKQEIEKIYPAAFPEEDLLPLVKELLVANEEVLNLAATRDSEIIGHAAFTTCQVEGQSGKVSLLGPIAVEPGQQGGGVGSALIEKGIEMVLEEGFTKVLVLGDPKFYGRFGFVEEMQVKTPFPILEEWKTAWQSIVLNDEKPVGAGKLVVPKMWQKPELWSE